jgi:hypothetical protein
VFLFLDDDAFRRHTFLQHVIDGTTVENVEQTIEALKKRQWPIVFLDHDLGGETFVDPEREDTGMAVVRWVVENRPKVGQFIIHSLNEPAAREMVRKLEDVGYNAFRMPFIRIAWANIEIVAQQNRDLKESHEKKKEG